MKENHLKVNLSHIDFDEEKAASIERAIDNNCIDESTMLVWYNDAESDNVQELNAENLADAFRGMSTDEIASLLMYSDFDCNASFFSINSYCIETFDSVSDLQYYDLGDIAEHLRDTPLAFDALEDFERTPIENEMRRDLIDFIWEKFYEWEEDCNYGEFVADFKAFLESRNDLDIIYDYWENIASEWFESRGVEVESE